MTLFSLCMSRYSKNTKKFFCISFHESPAGAQKPHEDLVHQISNVLRTAGLWVCCELGCFWMVQLLEVTPGQYASLVYYSTCPGYRQPEKCDPQELKLMEPAFLLARATRRRIRHLSIGDVIR